MKNFLMALTAFTCASTTWGAVSYSRFAHPKGDYAIEYPSTWKRSFGLQTLSLRPEGRQGTQVRISLELYPFGKNSPATAEDFISDLMKTVGKIKKLEAQETTQVSGVKAKRLLLSETVQYKDRYKQPLPGPMRELYFIIPLKSWYYVLKLSGIGPAFDQALPEFENIARKIELKAPAP